MVENRHLLKLLEEQIDVCPVSWHPVKSLSVQSLGFNVRDGLVQEHWHRVVTGRLEVVQGWLDLHTVGLGGLQSVAVFLQDKKDAMK